MTIMFVTSAKEIMQSSLFVCLSVCLFVTICTMNTSNGLT